MKSVTVDRPLVNGHDYAAELTRTMFGRFWCPPEARAFKDREPHEPARIAPKRWVTSDTEGQI